MGLVISEVETVQTFASKQAVTASAAVEYPLAQFEAMAMGRIRSLLQRHLDSLGLTAAIDPTEMVTEEMIDEFLDLADALWFDLDLLMDGFGLDTLPLSDFRELVERAMYDAQNKYIDSMKRLVHRGAMATPIYGEVYAADDYVPGTGTKPPEMYQVQYGDVREIMHDLGGGSTGEMQLSSGIAGGRIMSELLGANGLSTNEKMWLYGETSRREFNGHRQMDGLVFTEWTDPALEISPQDQWLRTQFYRPGDHWGCACVVVPYVPNFGVPIERRIVASAEVETIQTFACRDASCRPPTSGGTGGSSPAYQRNRGVVPTGYGPKALRDVTLRGVRVTYSPDYPDKHPDPGEIVWAKVPFEDDPSQSKDRPVLIIGRVDGSDTLAAIQLTSQIKGRRGELVIGSGSWDPKGRNSALKLDRIIQVSPDNYRREGSVVDKKMFDAVIGRLSAYHRTPVIAASAEPEVVTMEFGWNPYQPRDRRGRWAQTRGGSRSDTPSRSIDALVRDVRIERVKCSPRPCVSESLEWLSRDPARADLHKRMVEDSLKGATPPPTLMILGGGGGAGKSTVLKKLDLGDGKAVINADDFKTGLPEYDKLVKLGDTTAAAFVHEESSALAKDAQNLARERGLGVVLDQTGANPTKVAKQIDDFLAAGYTDIRASYVTIPTQVAVDRAQARAARSGRAVPEAILRAAHRDVSRGFEDIARDPRIQEVTLYDNSGTEPVLIARGGGGQLEVLDQTRYDEFLRKGDE